MSHALCTDALPEEFVAGQGDCIISIENRPGEGRPEAQWPEGIKVLPTKTCTKTIPEELLSAILPREKKRERQPRHCGGEPSRGWPAECAASLEEAKLLPGVPKGGCVEVSGRDSEAKTLLMGVLGMEILCFFITGHSKANHSKYNTSLQNAILQREIITLSNLPSCAQKQLETYLDTPLLRTFES